MSTWVRGVIGLAALAIFTSGCGTSSSTSVTAPSGSRCGVTATAQPPSVDSPGGTIAIQVSANRECAWEARSESDWLALRSGATGQGDGSITLAAAGNSATNERRGAVVVNDRRVEITQGAAPCVFALDRRERTVGSGGGRVEVAVSAQPGCQWAAVSHDSWLEVMIGATGQGAGAVQISVAPNEAFQGRSGQLTIAGLTFSVNQSGATPPTGPGPNPTPTPTPDPNPTPTPDPTPGPTPAPTPTPTPTPGPCTFTVAPLSASYTEDGGTGTVAVTASATTCAWTASAGVAWIGVGGATSRVGSGAVSYSVANNTATTSRAGTLSVAGRTVAISQAAATAVPPTSCTFTVAPTSATSPADGGPAQVTVTASAPTCTWTAASGDAWIAISGPAGGTGSGTLSYSVAGQTATTSRAGTLTVAGTTVTITQAAAAAAPCTFTVAPTSPTFTAVGGPGQVTVTASASTCTWTGASGDAWIAITAPAGGTGSGTLSYTVASQIATTSRAGTLTVAGTTVTVTQAAATPAPCTFTVAPTAASFTAAGGPGQVTVTASAPTCAWTGASGDAWIGITGPAGGTGSGPLSYTVASQTATTRRTGTLTVAGTTVTIDQAPAAPPPPCSFTVAPTALTVPLLGATGREIQVTTRSDCTWTAVSNDNWITIASGASGTGDGTVRINVGLTLLTSRSGTLTVAGQTVTVSQSGILLRERE